LRLRADQRLQLGLSLAMWAGFLAAFLVLGTPRVFSAVEPRGGRITTALFGERADLGVKCGLCPFRCFLPEGTRGKCRVRGNWNGRLVTLVYGQPVSLAVDPIEKKPVFHLLPGSAILSFATVGCPLRCSFCQNWNISQCWPEEAGPGRPVPPADIVKMAVGYRIPSIAYTYSEPVVFFEYMLETARLAKMAGLHNVMVTSGWINPEPLARLAPYLDVVKVDLKGYSPRFYRNEVGGRLEPVLATLLQLKRLGVMVEVVNLVVPTRNDADADFDGLTRWVRRNLGADTPVFFTRFHPEYRMRNLPPTPLETLDRAREVARRNGLEFVYLGNVPPGHGGEDTVCPSCGTVLIRRNGYQIERDILRDGMCPACGRRIPGIWR
jgi:pyruvate formate lyase activating enzyme